MRNIGEWIYNNRLVSLAIVIWAVMITTYVVYKVFSDTPPVITAGTATAFATFFALPGIGIAMWKWRSGDKSGQ